MRTAERHTLTHSLVHTYHHISTHSFTHSLATTTSSICASVLQGRQKKRFHKHLSHGIKHGALGRSSRAKTSQDRRTLDDRSNGPAGAHPVSSSCSISCRLHEFHLIAQRRFISPFINAWYGGTDERNPRGGCGLAR